MIMATIFNKMVKNIADSISRNQIQRLFQKSFLMGAMAYFVFLFTLATSYWFISEQFRFGLTKIDGIDLIISWVGFIATFVTYFINGIKANNFYK